MKETDPVKIVTFEAEAFKRLQMVELSPSPSGLTVIGGNNRQGKTSALDAIAAALGGEKFVPASPIHDGSEKGSITITLSNGLTVQRTFTKNGTYLKVNGSKSGQGILNKFITSFALDISTFLDAGKTEKAKILLDVIGVDVAPFDAKIEKMYAERLVIGQQRDTARGHAESMVYNEDVPDHVITPTEIMGQLNEKMKVNAANANLRQQVENLKRQKVTAEAKVEMAKDKITDLRAALARAQVEHDNSVAALNRAVTDLESATTTAASTVDQDVSQLELEIERCDEINAKVRQNADREKALCDVESLSEQYRELDKKIEAVRAEKMKLLNSADLPLPELSIENGALIYRGRSWDGMSHSEQLIVSTAIVRRLNPNMGFVLLDKLESMDFKTLCEFGAWLIEQNLQAIATRVSNGSECSIIIEDGLVVPKVIKEEKEIDF